MRIVFEIQMFFCGIGYLFSTAYLLGFVLDALIVRKATRWVSQLLWAASINALLAGFLILMLSGPWLPAIASIASVLTFAHLTIHRAESLLVPLYGDVIGARLLRHWGEMKKNNAYFKTR